MLFSFVLRIVRPDPPVSSAANTAVSAEDTTRPKADLPSHKGLEKTSTVVTAPCASSREVEIEIARAVVNKDEEALEGLIQRQHVPVLEPATKVTVIGTIEGFTEIKVDSGYDIGTFCWVVDTFLK